MAGVSQEFARQQWFTSYANGPEIFDELVKRGRLRPKADGLFHKEDLDQLVMQILPEINGIKKELVTGKAAAKKTKEDKAREIIAKEVAKSKQRANSKFQKQVLAQIVAPMDLTDDASESVEVEHE